MSKFIEFLEENTRQLRKWPAWKRNMLGPVFSESEEKQIEEDKNQSEVMIVFPTAPTGAEILKSCWNRIQWIGDSYLPKAIDDAMASYAGALKLEIIDLNMRIAGLQAKLNTATQVFSSSAESLNGTIVMELMELFKVEAGKQYEVVEKIKTLKTENENLKMCASAGESMGVEMLKLETENARLNDELESLKTEYNDFYNSVQADS